MYLTADLQAVFRSMPAKWKAPLKEPPAARFYIAVAFDEDEHYHDMKKKLAAEFGKIDFETNPDPLLPVPSLYGGHDYRKFRVISFERPIAREELVDLRRRCLALEVRHQKNGRLLVELDPGYVHIYGAVRTALEEDFHRIYLYAGIYGESLYYFEKISYRPWLHTPDFFRSPEILVAFNDLRLIVSQA